MYNTTERAERLPTMRGPFLFRGIQVKRILGVYGLTKSGALVDLLKASRGGSKQIPQDPFRDVYGPWGLVSPPYDFEQLLQLRELNPMHSAALEQKTLDIAGLGWDLVADADEPSDAQYQELSAFLEDPNPELTLVELLRLVWLDYETLGWGALEVVRDGRGRPAELYHVPAHTLRAHKDRIRFAQIPSGGTMHNAVWFKAFGAEGEYDAFTGEPGQDLPEERRANELLIFRQHNSRSIYYGIPGYVSALGAIAAFTAVQEYNLSYFENWAFPGNLVVLKGDALPDDIQTVLEKAFREGHGRTQSGKFQTFRTMVLTLPMSGVEAEILQLKSPESAGFQDYVDFLGQIILMAHRVPVYRIGWARLGSLGGATAAEMLRDYKNSVVEPGQTILEHRFNRFLRLGFGEVGEHGKPTLDWFWKLADLDITDREAERRHWLELVSMGIATPNEARVALGIGDAEDNPEGDKFYIRSGMVPMEAAGQSPVQMSAEETRYALEDLERRIQERLERLTKPGEKKG